MPVCVCVCERESPAKERLQVRPTHDAMTVVLRNPIVAESNRLALFHLEWLECNSVGYMCVFFSFDSSCAVASCCLLIIPAVFEVFWSCEHPPLCVWCDAVEVHPSKFLYICPSQKNRCEHHKSVQYRFIRNDDRFIYFCISICIYSLLSFQCLCLSKN